MNEAADIQKSEIEAAWAVVNKSGVTPLPNMSLAEALKYALDNCPNCAARRSAKAATMRNYRANVAKRSRRRKKK